MSHIDNMKSGRTGGLTFLGTVALGLGAFGFLVNSRPGGENKKTSRAASSPVVIHREHYPPPAILIASDIPAAEFPEPSVDETSAQSDQDPDLSTGNK